MPTQLSRAIPQKRAYRAETVSSTNHTLVLLAAIMVLTIILSVVILSHVKDGSVMACDLDTCFMYPS